MRVNKQAHQQNYGVSKNYFLRSSTDAPKKEMVYVNGRIKGCMDVRKA